MEISLGHEQFLFVVKLFTVLVTTVTRGDSVITNINTAVVIFLSNMWTFLDYQKFWKIKV